MFLYLKLRSTGRSAAEKVKLDTELELAKVQKTEDEDTTSLRILENRLGRLAGRLNNQHKHKKSLLASFKANEWDDTIRLHQRMCSRKLPSWGQDMRLQEGMPVAASQGFPARVTRVYTDRYYDVMYEKNKVQGVEPKDVRLTLANICSTSTALDSLEDCVRIAQ